MDARRTSPTRTKATWKPRVDVADPCLLRARHHTFLLLDGGDTAKYCEPGRSPVAVLPYQESAAHADEDDNAEPRKTDGRPTPSQPANLSGAPDRPVALPASSGQPGRLQTEHLPLSSFNQFDLSQAERLPLLDPDQLPADLELSYAIVGGYDANAIEVRWRVPDMAMKPDGAAESGGRADGAAEPGGRADGADEPGGRAVALRWVVLKTFTGIQVKYPLPGKKPPLVFALADEDAYVYCDEPVCKECTFRCKQGFVLYAAFDGLGIVRLPVSPNQR